MNPHIEEIQSCQYLFMHEIGEPIDNELRIVIHEAKAGVAGKRKVAEEQSEVLKKILEKAAPIEHGADCKIFELYWPSYVAYSVRNESYTTVDDYEKFEGRLIVKYTKSRYLDFVSKATFADSTFPGPLSHFGIFCLNHIIDVISTEEPHVTVERYA